MKIHCPACGKEEEVPEGFRWRPFCSRRCKLADLGAWLDEVYTISRPLRPGEVPEDDEHLM
jgi:endogenous inhibitor of DNA gyrase (YacG/DUF329 family)